MSTVTAVATGTPDTRLPRELDSVNDASMPTPPPAFTSRMEVLDWLGHPDWRINGKTWEAGGALSYAIGSSLQPSTLLRYLKRTSLHEEYRERSDRGTIKAQPPLVPVRTQGSTNG